MIRRSQLNPQKGFTLVESLTTVCLGAVLLSQGIPSMMNLASANRITTELNTFTAHLHLARSEAIKTNYVAVICPSKDGDTCLGSQDWHNGYMLFIDQDSDRKRDKNEPVIRYHPIDNQVLTVDAGRRKTISYQSTGWAKGSNLTVTFCALSGNTKPRAVVVSMTGRSRIADIHPNGDALNCS